MMLAEIFASLVSWSVAFIHTYGPYSVFIITILEEMLVPIPSPLVLMGSGFILVPSGISVAEAAIRIFFVVALPASIGATIGSFFVYGIGYYGGKPLVKKLTRFVGVSAKDVLKQEKRFAKKKSVWASIAVLRAVPFFPVALVSLTAGVLRISWKKYASATFIGSIPRTFILGMFGWMVGSEYAVIGSKLNTMEGILAALIAIGAVYMLYRYRHKYEHHYKRIMNSIPSRN